MALPDRKKETSMKLSYRARRTWHRVGIAALAIAVLAALMIFVWTVWLGRYVVYTRDGATLDFNSSAEMIDGVVAQEPPTQETVSVVYNEGEDAIDTGSEMTQLNGFFISAFDLTDDLATVQELADSIPNGSSVMIDVRSSYGYAYYSSTVAPTADSVNVTAVDALIASLKARNVYLIARLPAFQNYYYGLNNVSAGLAVDAGYLWMDDEGCYWLDPASSSAQNQLVQTVSELKSLGFREVVFSQFCFPSDMSSIVYNAEDRQAVLDAAAASLVSTCASSTFTVSFQADVGDLTIPEGRSRQYVANVSAVNASRTAESSGFGEDAPIRLVFLSESNDSRYNAYSVLRAINLIQSATNG